MDEFSIRFLHHTVTVTSTNNSQYIVSYDETVNGVVVPLVLGVIYPKEDIDSGMKWITDDDLSEELVQLLGEMIRDRGI
ncbi:hypothetical protein HDE68_000625 [Pedobacter cryoconitis]|uniref:Uncharacterized protein n=1 Tax=Pedobacter cryoconitis TaxID=188932 RepID=A0A7W8ZJ22_9SPHI|nr:hypothetical protein [Pedobacter cryoconitis]MBB5634740.1 hypothetical protein [Pedobacter cryoconitis]